MIRGLYSSAGALQMAERNHEVIANNLANANMPGFRRQLVAFETAVQQASSDGTSGTNPSSIGAPGPKPVTVFEPGAIQQTERKLDLALNGDGFFVVDGPNGPLYTRNGVFEMNADGRLQTTGGLPVSGTTGEIIVPPGTVKLQFSFDGTVVADGSEVGQLKLASFKEADLQNLVHSGTTLYSAPRGVVPQESQASVQQGFLEMSNVQIVDEMVRMIAGSRMYEASQRAMRAISDSVEQRTNIALQ